MNTGRRVIFKKQGSRVQGFKGSREKRKILYLSSGPLATLTIIFFLFFSFTSVHAGTLFKLYRRENSSCPYNPYEAGEVAVLTEEGNENGALRTAVESTISKDGFFKVVDRAHIEKIMKEQHFSLSFGNDENAVKAGKLVGAKSVFAVKISEKNITPDQGTDTAKSSVWVEKKYILEKDAAGNWNPAGKGKTIDIEVPYEFRKKVLLVTASGNLVSAEKGVAFCSTNQKVEFKLMEVKLSGDPKLLPPDTLQISEEGVKETIKNINPLDHIKADAKLVAWGELPTDVKMLADAISQAGGAVANFILPLVQERKREVGDGKTKMSKDAVTKAKAEQWDEAAKLWLLATQTEPRDHDAWGGLGVYYEKFEMKTKARECYQKARELSPKNKGFPAWLTEVGWMLHDKSDEGPKPDGATLTGTESVPYVVSYDKKTGEVKLNPKGNPGSPGILLMIYRAVPLVDPVSNEVLEVKEQPKGYVVLYEAKEKIWTGRVVEKAEEILTEDKAKLVSEGVAKERKTHLRVQSFDAASGAVTLSIPEGGMQVAPGDKISIISSDFAFDKKTHNYLGVVDTPVADAEVVSVTGSDVQAKVVGKPKRNPQLGDFGIKAK